jgi:hypothetical protein
MRGCLYPSVILPALLVACGCSRSTTAVQAAPATQSTAPPSAPAVGFDRNEYPGDAAMAAMRGSFAFTGYWITSPPGARRNTWQGKRAFLLQHGWGFLVLANGRLDAEILSAQKRGTPPANLARADAAIVIAAAKREGFPPHTILFLDQEEGGALLDEQAAYLLGWTEAVAASEFRPGVYASGQPVPDDPGTTITTIDDIRRRVSAQHLHEIAIFDAQDACPPAPGCTLAAKPLDASGELGLTAWQYSQSPRRPSLTRSCAASYAANGSCYAPGFPSVFLDLDEASSADPSHGR